MNSHSNTASARAALLIVFVALSAFGLDHKALNGTWTLLAARSDFVGQPVVQTGTVTIGAREWDHHRVSQLCIYGNRRDVFL